MTSRPTNTKLLLIAEARAASSGGQGVPVRRYRLARLPTGTVDAGKGSAARRA